MTPSMVVNMPFRVGDHCVRVWTCGCVLYVRGFCVCVGGVFDRQGLYVRVSELRLQTSHHTANISMTTVVPLVRKVELGCL